MGGLQLRLLRQLLERLGFEVREAADGLGGIDAWRAWQPHLICMDMRMPLLDGYESTRRIRAAEGEERTKILALTASAFEEDRQQVLAAGCDDFACRSYREEDLLARIGSQLGALFLYADEIVRLTATGAT